MRRTGIAAIGAFVAALAVTVSPAAAQAVPDLDVAVVDGTLSGFALPGVGMATAGYSMSGACGLAVAGQPVPFVDIPPDEGTSCGGVSGSGTFSSLGCGTGTATGSLSLTEPAGDTATVSYTIVFVAGVGGLVGNWSDGGASGPATGVVLLVPPSPSQCTGVVTQYLFNAVIAAEY